MTTDLLLAGGGLANSLIAYRLSELRPDLELRVIERHETLGEGHVWSFHEGDLDARQQRWIEPLIESSWSSHEVRFPGLTRRMESGYATVTAGRLDRVLSERLGRRIVRATRVVELTPNGATLEDGSSLTAAAVIDGRGAAPTAALRIGFQKFVGLHVELEAAASLAAPILMDATVEQLDGFRFVYTLPFTERRLLIEDTRYSDGPELDRGAMREAILDYARRQGWRVARVVEEEEGALPIVLDGDIDAFWGESTAGLPRSGMRAALFHPTTGYSLPEAVRLADRIAEQPSLTSEALDRLIRRRSRDLWRRGGFFRLLNRMLYQAAEPELRYRVLERFYRLPEPLIRRFYAGCPTFFDRLRTLIGRPPVPLGRALACVLPRSQPKPNAIGERS